MHVGFFEKKRPSLLLREPICTSKGLTAYNDVSLLGSGRTASLFTARGAVKGTSQTEGMRKGAIYPLLKRPVNWGR